MKKFINACIIRYRKWKKKKEADSNSILNWLWEFSKKVVIFVTLCYFIQCIYITVMINTVPDSAVLSTLVTESNETFRVIIGGYLLKSGIENAVKIKTAKIAKKHDLNIEGSYE
ncbi:MAG: hypothetical protein IJA34_01065 [Lachnospiraceae bacterium]|nr:hypothetical protein [Lachnospiraceae bacterium]